MGSDCFKGRREISDAEALRRCPRYNEHSHIQNFYKVGVVGEKTNDGEVHIGLKAMKTTKKDREFTRVNGRKNHPLDEELESRIPSIEEVMAGEQPFEIPNQLSQTASQEVSNNVRDNSNTNTP